MLYEALLIPNSEEGVRDGSLIYTQVERRGAGTR